MKRKILIVCLVLVLFYIGWQVGGKCGKDYFNPNHTTITYKETPENQYTAEFAYVQMYDEPITIERVPTPIEEQPQVQTVSTQPQLVSMGIFTATAYCPCMKCCGKTNGITASGTRATAGRTVAADKSFPFGTELYINGHRYIVEDRGGAITNKKIDIFFNNHAEALRYGRRQVEVFIMKQKNDFKES